MKLTWQTRDGRRGSVSSDRRVFTIGSAPSSDLSVSDAGLAAQHANLLARGDGLQVGGIGDSPLSVNGLRVVQSLLSPGDRVELGELTLEVLPEGSDGSASPPDQVLSRLIWFNSQLAGVADPLLLLDHLLDLLIAALDAERGLIVTGPPGESSVMAARGIDSERTAEDLLRTPDRLIARVHETGNPVVIVDATTDRELGFSSTVTNLGLKAVMALPMSLAGVVQGVIVLASSQVGQRFTPQGLQEAGLYAAQAALLVEQGRQLAATRHDLDHARQEIEGMKLGSLLSASEGMARIVRMLERVAPSDLSLLLTGETGTGKEVLAREAHRLRFGDGAPFVAINCGAIPEALIENELFGHVRGAFSDATTDRPGRVEAADGGTLFLDEIGEMPLPAQVRLLRVLQERTVTRLGESKPRPVAFRLISATHRDLDRAAAAGTFREDLIYRVRELEIRIPPLRERPEDLFLLARHFLDRYGATMGRPLPAFSLETRAVMLAHPWPGNIRELEGCVKRAIVLSGGATLEPEHLGLQTGEFSISGPTLEDAVRAFRGQLIVEALAEHGGNRRDAARALGVDERTIYRFLAEQG